MNQQSILQRQISRLLSLRDVRALALIAGLVVLIGVLYLVQSTQATYAGRHIRDDKLAIEQLERANEQLAIDIATLTNPTRMSQLALSLGLHPPKDSQIRYKPNLRYPVLVTPLTKKTVNPTAPESNWLTDWLRWFGWGTGTRAAEAAGR